MSLILITNHNENIYDISKEEKTFQKKKLDRHASSIRVKERQAVSEKVKHCHATMGVPEETPPDPANFLKKHTGKNSSNWRTFDQPSEPLRRDRTKYIYTNENYKKPKTIVNFVRKNIKSAIALKPKDPEHKVVIERHGESKPLWMGLEPVYFKMPVYGRTPRYLVKFIKEKEMTYQIKKDSIGIKQPKCRYITRGEREKLLNGLKQNWEELQKQYQGLPILTDTVPKKIRKSKLEADLKQLEKDIVLVERHPYIYVYNDNDIS